MNVTKEEEIEVTSWVQCGYDKKPGQREGRDVEKDREAEEGGSL